MKGKWKANADKEIVLVRISIIIPIYNGARLLKRCLDSVVKQLSNEIEVICVNDGSTDKSGEICDFYAECDARIRVLHLKHMGVSTARNSGIMTAKGEYLCFLDADDRLMPGAVSCLLAFTESGTDFAIGSYTECRHGVKNIIFRQAGNYDAPAIRKGFGKFDEMLSMLHAKLYKRSIIMENNIRFLEELPYGEDHIFNIEYSSYITNCTVTNKVLYVYSLGGTASSATYYENMVVFCLKLLQSYSYIFKTLQEMPDAFYKKKVKDQLLSCIEHYITFCPYEEALNKIAESLEAFDKYLEAEYIDRTNYESGLGKAILKRDPKEIYKLVFSQKRIRIYLRRVRYKRRR